MQGNLAVPKTIVQGESLETWFPEDKTTYVKYDEVKPDNQKKIIGMRGRR